MQPFFKWLGFPIRKSADQFIFADPRSLSQLITSFFASESQGIPRVPFLTFFYSCAFCAAWYVFFICSRFEYWDLSIEITFQRSRFSYPTAHIYPYCCLLFFNLLLPICQRTYPMCRFLMRRCADYFIHLHICTSPHLHIRKWRITDSNRWPPACKAGALASWANPPDLMRWRVLRLRVKGFLPFTFHLYPFTFLPSNVVPSRFELLTPTLSV